MDRKMKIGLIAAVVLVAAAILAYKSITHEPPTAVEEKTKSGKALLEQAQGQPVWLLFKSSTCYPCQQMLQVMQALRPEFQGKISFIVIEVNDPANQQLAREYNIQYVPTSFLYDRNHNLVDQHVGALGTAEMRAKLKALLEEQK